MYPLCVVKKDCVVVWVKGPMRLSGGAKVLWEKFESGEEADTEIQRGLGFTQQPQCKRTSPKKLPSDKAEV
ncbi:unnamed protein product [Sphagnum compactum]